MRKFKNDLFVKLAICFLVTSLSCRKNNQDISLTDGPSTEGYDIACWITTGDKNLLFKKIAGLSFGDNQGQPAIDIDTTTRFQEIDGFGYALTGGSAYLINQKLNASQRDVLLKELFLNDSTNIGISYLRISIGSSDLDDHVFSYDDLPSGQTDEPMAKFDLSPDKQNLIPVLKQILALNPDIKIMGSPWSAPAWMKTNLATSGGSLKQMYYPAYANYFVKYIQGMAQEGIKIDAITIQNEPENANNNPSMLMTALEEAAFVKNALGPAFQAAGITTKIVIFDHNCDHPEYPITVLNDPDAKKFIDGSAFHLYTGVIEALSTVHNAHQDRNVYFTEQWTSPNGSFNGDLVWHTKNLIIGATRNWSRNVIEWNLAADPTFHPHTDGGCTECLGALTIGTEVSRNVSYYIIAQASKFVRPGSVRVASTMPVGLSNVAFQTKDGKKVLIVLNETSAKQTFGIQFKGKTATTSLQANAVGTYVW